MLGHKRNCRTQSRLVMSDTVIIMKDGGERAGDNRCKEELVWGQQQQQQQQRLISRKKGRVDGGQISIGSEGAGLS